MTPYKLLFVCTANICRSPMAEAFAIAYATERRWAVEVKSAGVHAMPDNPAAPKSITAMREADLDITKHRSQPLSDELVHWADHILVMEIRHATKIRDRWPGADAKVMMLGNFGGVMEIADPYGAWFMGRYRTARDEIQKCVQTFMDRLPPRPLKP